MRSTPFWVRAYRQSTAFARDNEPQMCWRLTRLGRSMMQFASPRRLLGIHDRTIDEWEGQTSIYIRELRAQRSSTQLYERLLLAVSARKRTFRNPQHSSRTALKPAAVCTRNQKIARSPISTGARIVMVDASCRGAPSGEAGPDRAAEKQVSTASFPLSTSAG